MSTTDRRERDIFEKAIEIETHDERAAYVRSECGDNTDLIERVSALLRAHDQVDFLPPHPGDEEMTLPESTLSERPGVIIGRYKLLERIGEGGMAVVYMAEQERPVHRKVALKIIKLGMDTKSVIARFEAERQALAMMDHPNIAKIFDAGTTDTGRPYFVMELVKGVSITEYCDKNLLSTRERLDLFIQICSAVQHAHHKGIIHRDIKPTNVMVTLYEGRPLPMVIDFGIAKATSRRLTEKTLFTRYAQIIGTPEYMSPEQAELSDLDIDTRTDIYSLGVLLYKLLTGTTPFSEQELRKAGYLEMQRVIRQQEPLKPSTKLGTLGETLTDIAKYRASTPDLLTKAIRGDLDWIVMKSLEKTREKRYDTVSALAQDVQRHLKDEPILARAPSTLYILQKYLRRHRSLAVVVLIAVPLLATIIVMFLLWSRERIRFAKTEATRHEGIFIQANTSLDNNDLKGAIKSLEIIIDSPHVGIEARTLHDRILRDIQRQLRSFTDKINSDPDDPNNYLARAQYFHCLGNRKAVLADMKSYLSVLYPISEKDSKGRRLRDFLADLWASTPTNLGPSINTSSSEWSPCISADGLELFFTSNRSGSFEDVVDIYVSTRTTTDSSWGEPVNLGSVVNSPYPDGYPNISADGLLLFFSSFRSGGSGGADLYVTTRATKTDNWGPPVNLGPTVNSPYEEACCCLSGDSSTLYFSSKRPGGYGRIDLWQISITSLPKAEEKDHSDPIKIIEKGNDRKEG